MRKLLVLTGVLALLAVTVGIYAANETESTGQSSEIKNTVTKEVEVKSTEAKTEAPATEQVELKPGVYALFDTTMGKMVANLFDKEAPNTVANFVGLAEGTKEFADPKTGKRVKRPFYDGLIFHRVIPGFMIQGGCPLGQGTGGTDKIKDEFGPGLKHDGPGMLSMANAGPNTGSCQFFVTEKATPWLDGKHAIFGKLIYGLDVQKKIADTPRDSRDRPKTNVVMNRVRIVRVAEGEKVTLNDVISGKAVKEPVVEKPEAPIEEK